MIKAKKDGFAGSLLLVVPRKHQKRRARTTADNQLKVIAIGYYPCAVNHEIHRAKGSEDNIFIFCRDGAGWVTVDGKRYIITADQAIVISAGVPHSYGADEADPWTIQWIHFEAAQTNEWLSLFREKKMFIPFEVRYRAGRDALFDEMTYTLRRGFSFDQCMQTNAMLAYYFSMIIFSLPADVKPESSSLDRVVAWIHEHFQESITLEDLASMAGFSISHFSTQFRQLTGYAPLSYVRLIRIQKSCQFLQLSTLRINEIAERVGFLDPNYFSRQFTNFMRKSPRAYRASLKKT